MKSSGQALLVCQCKVAMFTLHALQVQLMLCASGRAYGNDLVYHFTFRHKMVIQLTSLRGKKMNKYWSTSVWIFTKMLIWSIGYRPNCFILTGNYYITCPNHTDYDIYSNYSYLDTLGTPLNSTLNLLKLP